MGQAHARTGAIGLLVWGVSSPAYACGNGAMMMDAVIFGLPMLLGLSLVAVLSLRPATAALGRMAARRPTLGMKVAHSASWLLFGFSVASTILWGGLLFGLLLVM